MQKNVNIPFLSIGNDDYFCTHKAFVYAISIVWKSRAKIINLVDILNILI